MSVGVIAGAAVAAVTLLAAGISIVKGGGKKSDKAPAHKAASRPAAASSKPATRTSSSSGRTSRCALLLCIPDLDGHRSCSGQLVVPSEA